MRADGAISVKLLQVAKQSKRHSKAPSKNSKLSNWHFSSNSNCEPKASKGERTLTLLSHFVRKGRNSIWRRFRAWWQQLALARAFYKTLATCSTTWKYKYIFYWNITHTKTKIQIQIVTAFIGQGHSLHMQHNIQEIQIQTCFVYCAISITFGLCNVYCEIWIVQCGLCGTL